VVRYPCLSPQSNFGPADGTTQVIAWASPSINDSLVFFASNCSVVEAHDTIMCSMPPGVGAVLAWRVVVEGQSNGVPLSAFGAPTISSAALVEAGVETAQTTGGTVMAVVGENFGYLIDVVVVSITAGAGTMVAGPCNFTVPHREVWCTLPPGVGTISRVSIAVLGQTGSLNNPVGLAYAAPTARAVTPDVWPADVASLSVTVTGTGFGMPAWSQVSLPVVTLRGTWASDCGSEGPEVQGRSVVVRNDNTLQFQVEDPVAHVVASWTVGIEVAGQALSTGPLVVHTRAPAPPSLTFDTPPQPGRYFLTILGSDFGPALGRAGCSGDVEVTVAGQRCTSLVMTQASFRRATPPPTPVFEGRRTPSGVGEGRT
jgi:hypothetical protein